MDTCIRRIALLACVHTKRVLHAGTCNLLSCVFGVLQLCFTEIHPVQGRLLRLALIVVLPGFGTARLLVLGGVRCSSEQTHALGDAIARCSTNADGVW